MNSRQVVQAAIEFKRPDRIPYEVWVDMDFFRRDRSPEEVEAVETLLASATRDFVRHWPAPVREWRSVGVQRVDEWGVTWYDNNAIGHPLQAGWELLDEYDFPDPYEGERFDHIPGWKETHGDKYILGSVVPTLFERMWMLRGLTNALRDPYRNYDRFVYLRDRVMEFNTGMLRQWLRLGVDGVWFSDDWGSQQGLLISPEDWRRLYKPCYTRLFDMAHEADAHVWLHSCGNIRAIVPDLIDIGVDVLNPVQPRAMDVDELGRRFGGKLCFHGGADVQRTLPHGSPRDVEEEVQHLVETFGGLGGGYIGGTSHTVLPDTPLENIEALFNAFERYAQARLR